MNRFIATFLLIFMTIISYGQELPVLYKIYDSSGNETSWERLVSMSESTDLVFFGEAHNSKIIHFLQLELLKELSQSTQWVLAMEMFESDQQGIIDEYMAGAINTKAFQEDVRKWNNYMTDYKGLVEFAKKNNIPLIASNVPRRYAKKMYEEGPEALEKYSKEHDDYLPKFPMNVDTTLESYKALLMPMHGSEKKYLLEAQILKDAVMAQNICDAHDNYKRPVLHINGYYHSDMREGILSQFSKKCKKNSTVVISHLTLDEFPISLSEEHAKKGDFIIVENQNFYNYYD